MAAAKAGRSRADFRRFFAYVKETGLDEPLKVICRAHAVTLMDVFLDATGPTVQAARLECWWTLMSEYGKSAGEVANLFAREHGSILYGMRLLRDAAEHAPATKETIRALVRQISARTAQSRTEAGRRLAATKRRPKQS